MYTISLRIHISEELWCDQSLDARHCLQRKLKVVDCFAELKELATSHSVNYILDILLEILATLGVSFQPQKVFSNMFWNISLYSVLCLPSVEFKGFFFSYYKAKGHLFIQEKGTELWVCTIFCTRVCRCIHDLHKYAKFSLTFFCGVQGPPKSVLCRHLQITKQVDK